MLIVQKYGGSLSPMQKECLMLLSGFWQHRKKAMTL